MARYRSILWQELDLRLGDLRIRELAVHHHLPELNRLGNHRHGYWQFLCYLSGSGEQVIDDRSHAVSTGSLALIPPAVPHSFRRTSKASVKCCVLDFEFSGAKAPSRARFTELHALDLGEVRANLTRIGKLNHSGDVPWELERAACTFSLAGILFTASGIFPDHHRPHISPILQKISRILQDPATDRLPLTEIAAQTGYQPVYLNRVIRRETGLTLGQWRTRERIARAKQALLDHELIGEAAAAVGMDDQNYFARWFRMQTGLPPGAFRQLARLEDAKTAAITRRDND